MVSDLQRCKLIKPHVHVLFRKCKKTKQKKSTSEGHNRNVMTKIASRKMFGYFLSLCGVSARRYQLTDNITSSTSKHTNYFKQKSTTDLRYFALGCYIVDQKIRTHKAFGVQLNGP